MSGILKRRHALVVGKSFVVFSVVFWALSLVGFYLLAYTSSGRDLVAYIKKTGHLDSSHSIALGASKSCKFSRGVMYTNAPVKHSYKNEGVKNGIQLEKCVIRGQTISGTVIMATIRSDVKEEVRNNALENMRKMLIEKFSAKTSGIFVPSYYFKKEILSEPIGAIVYGLRYPQIWNYGDGRKMLIFKLDSYSLMLATLSSTRSFSTETDIALLFHEDSTLSRLLQGSFYVLPIYLILLVMFFSVSSRLNAFSSMLISGERVGSLFVLIVASMFYASVVVKVSTPYAAYAYGTVYVVFIFHVLFLVLFKTRFTPVLHELKDLVSIQRWTSNISISNIDIDESSHEVMWVPLYYKCESCTLEVPIVRPFDTKKLTKDAVLKEAVGVESDIALACPKCGFLTDRAKARVKELRDGSLKGLGGLLLSVVFLFGLSIGIMHVEKLISLIPYIGWLLSPIVGWFSGISAGLFSTVGLIIVGAVCVYVSLSIFRGRKNRDVWACVSHGYLLDNTKGVVPDKILTCIVNKNDRHKFSLIPASRVKFV